MTLRARLVMLLLAVALATACTGAPPPSAVGLAVTPTRSPTPTPTPTPTPRATAKPCVVAVVLLGSFTKRLADDLASLRPLVVAKNFDLGSTLAATRRVSASLTAYPGLESTLGACAATAKLAPRVKALRARANAALDKADSASIINANARRTAAVTLFGRLPEVLALSKAGKSVADGLKASIEVARVSKASAKPLGKLPPLPTPPPCPLRR
jgi:hypothetical protein